jgi:quercetin dioxygenase-like cupin family protein
MSGRGNIRAPGAGFVLLLLASSIASAATPVGQLRLDPNDVAALSKHHAGAGTSGVAGIQTTRLSGDPAATGPYTIALRVPAHTVIAAHTHRDDRSAVVVSGTWWFGYGPHNTQGQLKALGPGSFYTEPGGRAHFARTGDQAVVVYITGMGPTDTRYVDASDAPRP